LTIRIRKQLILPAEHGAWAWLLVPFGVGTATSAGSVQAVGGMWHTAVTLVLLGSLAAFLARQPATVWLRVRQGKARRSDGPPAAALTLGLSSIALLCLLGLLLTGHTQLLWLLLPLLPVLGLYVETAVRSRAQTRTLWLELLGAAALAVTAPAAYSAATGRLDTTAWLLWLLLGLQNLLGVYYVRLRIADTHGRETNRRLPLLCHLIGLGIVGLLILTNWLPWLTALPFAAFLLRAIWTWAEPRPVANIKRFGFLEVGVEILSGLVFVAAL
jgi:hypothetical protein